MTSRSSGSPVAPGSLVRSSTAIDRTRRRQRPRRGASVGNGRYRRTFSRPTRSPAATSASTASSAAPDARAHQHDDPIGVGGADVVDEPVARGRSGRRARRTPPRRCRAPRRRTGWPPRGPGRRRRGSAPSRAATGASGVRPRTRWASTASSSTSARRSASSSSGDLVHLVRRAEAVEEVQERHPRPQRRGVGDGGEVVRLLHAAGGEHRPAGRAGVHHVGVVAEDRQGVGGDGAGGDVHHARRQLAGDLEHVRHHQQQALRRRERRGQRARLQRAVERRRRHRPRTASRRPRAPRPTGSGGRRPPTRRPARPSATTG